MPSSRVKAFVFALVATPFLYGAGVSIASALGISEGYSEGRIILALSFFAGLSIGLRVFNTPKANTSSGEQNHNATS